MKHQIILTVNEETREVLVDARDTLLSVLREKLQLTGTKEGCDSGKCGTCTVLIDGKAIRSCLTLAISARKGSITTIEGLSRNGTLHPLQTAFIECGAVQCGFCTPGMILLAKAFLDENPDPGEEEIKRALCANICRCTGYIKIIEAVQSVVKKGSHRENGVPPVAVR